MSWLATRPNRPLCIVLSATLLPSPRLNSLGTYLYPAGACPNVTVALTHSLPTATACEQTWRNLSFGILGFIGWRTRLVKEGEGTIEDKRRWDGPLAAPA